MGGPPPSNAGGRNTCGQIMCREPLSLPHACGPCISSGKELRFRKRADVSGLVMTKLDGTAKGGVLVALADKFGLPIHAIGVGEQIDDLAPFDPEEFARALTGQFK